MSIIDYVEKLRAKPEAQRRRLLLWSTSLLTLVIALIWLVNLKYVLSVPATGTTPVAVATSTSTPTVVGAFAQTYARIKEGWQVILKR